MHIWHRLKNSNNTFYERGDKLMPEKHGKKPEQPLIKRRGDSEHDPVLHSALKPHTAPSEYDVKYHCYRTTGG